jgi:hypothetical protein
MVGKPYLTIYTFLILEIFAYEVESRIRSTGVSIPAF